jgi:hypothetical protein
MHANASKSIAKLPANPHDMSRAINQTGLESTACTRRNHGIQFRYFPKILGALLSIRGQPDMSNSSSIG